VPPGLLVTRSWSGLSQDFQRLVGNSGITLLPVLTLTQGLVKVRVTVRER
jgi:hypothetical protein